MRIEDVKIGVVYGVDISKLSPSKSWHSYKEGPYDAVLDEKFSNLDFVENRRKYVGGSCTPLLPAEILGPVTLMVGVPDGCGRVSEKKIRMLRVRLYNILAGDILADSVGEDLTKLPDVVWAETYLPAAVVVWEWEKEVERVLERSTKNRIRESRKKYLDYLGKELRRSVDLANLPEEFTNFNQSLSTEGGGLFSYIVDYHRRYEYNAVGIPTWDFRFNVPSSDVREHIARKYCPTVNRDTDILLNDQYFQYTCDLFFATFDFLDLPRPDFSLEEVAENCPKYDAYARSEKARYETRLSEVGFHSKMFEIWSGFDRAGQTSLDYFSFRKLSESDLRAWYFFKEEPLKDRWSSVLSNLVSQGVVSQEALEEYLNKKKSEEE